MILFSIFELGLLCVWDRAGDVRRNTARRILSPHAWVPRSDSW